MLERGIMDQICAKGEETHARRWEIMDQVCARGKRIHARKGKIEIK